MDPPSPHATTLSRTLVRSKSCSSSWPPKGLGCRTQPDPGQRLTAKSSRHSASVATSVPALAHSLVDNQLAPHGLHDLQGGDSSSSWVPGVRGALESHAASAMAMPAIGTVSSCSTIARLRVITEAGLGSRIRTPSNTLTTPSRSEEHTSELQSLMRISYAVFCLKKKQSNTYNNGLPKRL